MQSFNFVGVHFAWLNHVIPLYIQLFLLGSLGFSTLFVYVVMARFGRNTQAMIMYK